MPRCAALSTTTSQWHPLQPLAAPWVGQSLPCFLAATINSALADVHLFWNNHHVCVPAGCSSCLSPASQQMLNIRTHVHAANLTPMWLVAWPVLLQATGHTNFSEY